MWSSYTCQLFLRYKREIFILGVLGFLKTTQSFPKIPEEVRSLPKTSEVCRRRSYWENAYPQNQRLRGRYNLSFIHFTHGFRSFHGSELTYFWKLCQARREQLKFSNQAWEIGPQAWAGVRSKYSTRSDKISWDTLLLRGFQMFYWLPEGKIKLFFPYLFHEMLCRCSSYLIENNKHPNFEWRGGGEWCGFFCSL